MNPVGRLLLSPLSYPSVPAGPLTKPDYRTIPRRWLMISWELMRRRKNPGGEAGVLSFGCPARSAGAGRRLQPKKRSAVCPGSDISPALCGLRGRANAAGNQKPNPTLGYRAGRRAHPAVLPKRGLQAFIPLQARAVVSSGGPTGARLPPSPRESGPLKIKHLGLLWLALWKARSLSR